MAYGDQKYTDQRYNLGGGSVDTFYEPYINGEKELRQLNDEYRSNMGLVR